MATGLLETGPKLDWTRDNKIFDRFQIWKEKVELIFSSALEESSSKQKVSYLRYWMGEQGIPLVKKWTALGKLDFSSAEEDALSSGYILCCDIGQTCIGKNRCQDDIFPRIELIPSFVLSSDNTNYNNVI